MTLLSALVALIALVVLGAGGLLIYLMQYVRPLSRERFTAPRGELITVDHVSATDQKAISVAVSGLITHGFVPTQWLRLSNPNVGQTQPPYYFLLMRVEPSNTFAMISRCSNDLDDRPYDVVFANLRADGKGICTFNRTLHWHLTTAATLHAVDAFAIDLESHWDRHKDRLLHARAQIWVNDPAQMAQLWLKTQQERYEHGLTTGELVRAGDELRYSWKKTWQLAWRTAFAQRLLSTPYNVQPDQAA